MTTYGPCCICGRAGRIDAILQLNRRAPIAGTGWGCFVCGLPMDGAIAVVCDICIALQPAPVAALRYLVLGYLADGLRIEIDQSPQEDYQHKEGCLHVLP